MTEQCRKTSGFVVASLIGKPTLETSCSGGDYPDTSRYHERLLFPTRPEGMVEPEMLGTAGFSAE